MRGESSVFWQSSAGLFTGTPIESIMGPLLKVRWGLPANGVKCRERNDRVYHNQRLPMNPQEKVQLQQFLENLGAASGVDKLPEADQLIRQAFSRQPDAAYLLVQRAMLLEQGLAQAKARIAELEEAQAPSRSFFGSGYQPNSGVRTPPGSPAPNAPAAAGAPVYGGPAYGAPSVGSGAGSFLGQAAATAAGVAGGAFLFEGLEHLFGPQQSGFGSERFIPSNENVTVNNFYEGREDGRSDPINDDDSVTHDDSVAADDANFDDDPSSDASSDWT